MELQIKFCANKLLNIFGFDAAHFGFCDSDGRNALTRKNGVALNVALFLNRVIVPVVTVGFKGNGERRQKEINPFSTNYMFLLKGYLQILKGTPHFLFQRRFAQVETRALVGAKAGRADAISVNLERFTTSFTVNCGSLLSSRVLARLRAIFFIFGFGARLKGFFAVSANKVVKWPFVPVPHAPLAAKPAFMNFAVSNFKTLAAIIAVPKNVWLTSRDAVADLRTVFLIWPAKRSGRAALGTDEGLHLNLLSKIDLSISGGARSLGCVCQRVITPLKPYYYFTTSGVAEGAF